MLAELALLAIGSTLTLRLEESRGVSRADAAALMSSLWTSLERRDVTVVDVETKTSTVSCRPREECIARLRASSRVDDVVFVRMIGIPNTIRVVVERYGADHGTSDRVPRGQIDLPRGTPATPDSFTAVVAQLYPKMRAGPAASRRAVDLSPPPQLEPATEAITAVEPAPRSRTLEWSLLAGSAIAGTVATIFAVRNLDAISEGETSSDPARVAELRDAAYHNGLAANVLFTAAAIGAATSAILFIAE